jgi:hypothetical protein
MNTSKFIDRTVRPVDTFRGIGKPVNPPRVTVPITVPTRKPNQFIQDIVNVTMGPDIGYGHRVRRFNLGVENALTHKSRYLWINEDDIS